MKIKLTRGLKLLIGILLVLTLIRAVLPYAALSLINNELKQFQGYSGQVQSVSFTLLKGQASLHTIHLEKLGSKGAKPIFNAQTITIGIEWPQLAQGKFNSEIIIYSPDMHVVLEKPAPSPGPGLTPSQAWRQGMKHVLPFKIDRVIVHDGKLSYSDRIKQPEFDISFSDIEARLTGLQSLADDNNPMPANLIVHAKAFNQANVEGDMDFNPQARLPTFKLEAQMENLQLNQMNDFLKRYTKLEAKTGSFSFYLEAAAAQGKITGYIKPFLSQLQAKVPPEDKGSLIKKAYKGVVQAANSLLKNADTGQVATQLDLSGNINNPDASLWSTIANLLQNAFLRALLPGIDHSIEL